MPELPEVETVRLGLEKKYLNLKFKHIDVFYDKILENISSNEFKELSFILILSFSFV